jgi:peptide deformylase
LEVKLIEMSMQEIIQLDKKDFFNKNVSLRKLSEPVINFDEGFQNEVDNLIETFRGWEITVGLSAPQIGIFKRFSVINLKKSKPEDDFVIVNPVITFLSGKKDIKKESCMSLPHVRGDVERRDKLHLHYQDRYGNVNEIQLEGFKARVVLHEIDHLDGILFVDRMMPGKALEQFELKWE